MQQNRASPFTALYWWHMPCLMADDEQERRKVFWQCVLFSQHSISTRRYKLLVVGHLCCGPRP